MGDGVNLSFSEAVYMLQYKEKHLKKKKPSCCPQTNQIPRNEKGWHTGLCTGSAGLLEWTDEGKSWHWAS